MWGVVVPDRQRPTYPKVYVSGLVRERGRSHKISKISRSGTTLPDRDIFDMICERPRSRTRPLTYHDIHYFGMWGVVVPGRRRPTCPTLCQASVSFRERRRSLGERTIVCCGWLRARAKPPTHTWMSGWMRPSIHSSVYVWVASLVNEATHTISL